MTDFEDRIRKTFRDHELAADEIGPLAPMVPREAHDREGAGRRRWQAPTAAVGAAALALVMVLGVQVVLGDGGDEGDGNRGTSPAAPATPSAPANGITADRVEIAVPDLSSPNLGFVGTDQPLDTAGAMDALASWVAANGGMGGRDLSATLVPGDLLTVADQSIDLQTCEAVTASAPPFAILAPHQLTDVGRSCYAGRRTFVVDVSPAQVDDELLETVEPYGWAPGSADYPSFVEAEMSTLVASGFFAAGGTVRLAVVDTQLGARAGASAQGVLDDAGITVVTDTLSAANTGVLGTTNAAVVRRAKSAGDEHLVLLGDRRLTAVALSAADTLDATFSVPVGTADEPRFLEQNPEVVLLDRLRQDGVGGLGTDPVRDLAGSSGSAPANATRALCGSIMSDAGVANSGPATGGYVEAMALCDGVMFLKAVLDVAPEGVIEVGQFRDAAWSLGDSYQSPRTLRTELREGSYTGSVAGRPLVWDPAAGRFGYQGDEVPIG